MKKQTNPSPTSRKWLTRNMISIFIGLSYICMHGIQNYISVTTLYTNSALSKYFKRSRSCLFSLQFAVVDWTVTAKLSTRFATMSTCLRSLYKGRPPATSVYTAQ